MGDHPQSIKILMLDSVVVLWRKGEKGFENLKKPWNLMLTISWSFI